MTVSREIRLDEFLIAGTDDDVSSMYRQLPERARDLQFGLVEDEVVVLDTETTGFNPASCSLLEIAAIRMRGGETIAEFQTYVDPGHAIPTEITELTGITQDDVTGAPNPREAVRALAEFAGGCNLIAHNASFDQGFIMRQANPGELPGQWNDTLSLSQIVLPRLKSHRLLDLAAAFGLATPTHRAMDDTVALGALWRTLLAGIQAMTPGLAARIAELSPQTDWPLRPYFAQATLEHPGVDFSLRRNRTERTQGTSLPPRPDADDIPLSFCDESRIDEAFSPTGALGSMYPDYEERQEQLGMAHEVAACLREGDIRVIEAGTGVGKSMAYLVPVAFAAHENKVTMGVATKTNALMDQLVYHELPRLNSVLGQDLSYIALKGYDHYLCLRKLEHMARADQGDNCDVISMIATLLSFTAQTSHGDLDALNISWVRLPRGDIQANANDCLKKRCPYFPRRCFLHGARRAATSADIVITNHALLFRDMQTDNGILPPIRHWVIDEAHGVEGEARRQLSSSITSRELDTMLGHLSNPKNGVTARVRKRADKLEGGDMLYGVTADIENRIGQIQLVAAEFFAALAELPSPNARDRGSYNIVTVWISGEMRQGHAWRELCVPGTKLADLLWGLNGRLADLISMLEQFEGEFVNQLAELSGVTGSVKDAVDALRLILDGTDERYVTSLQIDRNPRYPMQGLEAMRLDIGESLATDLYPQTRSLVFTSATLATAEREPFAHFLRATGLDRVTDKPVYTSIFASGYDYDHNMSVLLPSDMPEPNAPDYHEAFAQLLYEVHVAMGGSVLTLFTNRREMESFYRELKPRLANEGIDLIAQTRGTSTKSLRDRFLSDRSLSMFALKSFWEGFDAPGDTLRCVIIARLPFSRPDDPIAREREARDGRAAWGRYSLPEAVMDLKQAAGRLIRNSTDSGWLVLADARLQTKNYAKSFLRAMPTQDIRTLTISEIARLMETQEPGSI